MRNPMYILRYPSGALIMKTLRAHRILFFCMTIAVMTPFALSYAGVPLGSYLRRAFSEVAAWKRSIPKGDVAVPGIVVDYSPASSGQYIGSPGITILPNGEYLTKDDIFGPKQPKPRLTRVFVSNDQGKTWNLRSTVRGIAWASIFVHRGAVYMMGTNKGYGTVVIVKSTDDGRTWSVPSDRKSGLLRDKGKFHCAPVPVIEHRGRLWRAMEDATSPGGWGYRFRPFMMSVPADANLLDAEAWTSSSTVISSREWLGGRFSGWLEGNAIVDPHGGIANILRVSRNPRGETAAIVNISNDGKNASFDPEEGFVAFPGGAVKFTVRHDPQSNRYWALSNPMLPQHQWLVPSRVRNTLALVSSSDLIHWTTERIVLYHPDAACHGFQYVDWAFDGDDIIAVSRTAFDDAEGGACNQHNANYLTFHRLDDFRKKDKK